MVEGKIKCTYAEIFTMDDKGVAHKIFSLQDAGFGKVAFITDWVDPDERYVPVVVTDAAIKHITSKEYMIGKGLEVNTQLMATHPEYQLYVKNVAVEWKEDKSVSDPQLDILDEAVAEAERKAAAEAKKKKKSITAALLATVAVSILN